MLNTYTNTSQAVAVNETLTFNNTAISACQFVRHTAGSASIAITGTGYYLIIFNADAAITGSTAGNVTAQLEVDGTVYPGAEATFYSTAATDIGNLSFATLVKVQPNCCAVSNNIPKTLTVVNTGLAATYTNAALTVYRVRAQL